MISGDSFWFLGLIFDSTVLALWHPTLQARERDAAHGMRPVGSLKGEPLGLPTRTRSISAEPVGFADPKV